MARFKIHLKTETRAVLFSVELPLAVQGRQNKKTQAYFFVYPNDIRTLTLVDSETAASCKVATQQLKGATHCLRFTLDRLGTLVMPTDKDVRANVKNEATQHALAAVLLLAARQHFVVYVSGRSANRRELLSLCCAAKDFSSSWEKPARLGVIATLYGGKGGRVISYRESDRTTTSTLTDLPHRTMISSRRRPNQLIPRVTSGAAKTTPLLHPRPTAISTSTSANVNIRIPGPSSNLQSAWTAPPLLRTCSAESQSI
jgi:hypothetical protein